ncbi:MAG: cellobiose phosphorylase [Candidatus Omnitrophota bacterium]
MIYEFIDDKGSFRVKNPQDYNLYFPLTNQDGSFLSSISPNLAGDIKQDNDHFVTPPASIIDLKNNLLCRRDFFIKSGKKIYRLSEPYNDILEAGFLYHKIIKKSGAMRIEILNFIPYSLSVEVMQVRITNQGKKPINITPTSLIPLYGRPQANLRGHRHVSSLLNRVHLHKYGIFLKPSLAFNEKGHKENKTAYFCLGFEGESNAPLGQFPTIESFGGKGGLLKPEAIEKDIKPFTKKLSEFEGKEVIAGLRFKDKTLGQSQSAEYSLIIGIEPSGKQKNILNIFNKLNSQKKIKQSLEETNKYWLDYSNRINLDFKDTNFNGWLKWVKFQPTLRKLFGCSFLPHFDYGKGGRGWRDLWQDALGLFLTEPDKAKKIMIRSFEGVRIDGSNATIITKDGGFLSDRNRISRVWMDHGIWPYLSLRLYINRTGNLNIFNKNTFYFRDQLLSRAKEIDLNFNQKDWLLRTKSGTIYQGSILEHILIQHLTAFHNVGCHNIIRLENADWNDGLDMAPEKGESAAFSFMYAHNLQDLCLFLEELKKAQKTVTLLKELCLLLEKLDYNDWQQKQKKLSQYLEKVKNISGEKVELSLDELILNLREKSQHLFNWLNNKEWLKQGFFNGYYDNKSRKVEGRVNNKIRIMLASQVFAIMSGGATPKQIKITFSSIKKYLKDKKIKGFRLNTDFNSLCLDLGRAFSFSYGDKENGAFFSHMTVMLGFALYKQGCTKEGYKVISSIYELASGPRAQILPMIPEYFNSQGKGLYYYLTGSASWYIYTLIEEILGIKFKLGKLTIEPKLLPQNFFKDKIEVTFPLKNKKIQITFTKKNQKISSHGDIVGSGFPLSKLCRIVAA